MGGKRSARSRRGCAEHRALRGPLPCVSCGPLSPPQASSQLSRGSATTPRGILHTFSQSPKLQNAASATTLVGRTGRHSERAVSAGKGSTTSNWKKAPLSTGGQPLRGSAGTSPWAGPSRPTFNRGMHTPRLWRQGPEPVVAFLRAAASETTASPLCSLNRHSELVVALDKC